MRRSLIGVVLVIGLILSGCSLAEDVTPPPALATQQASLPQATLARPQATSPASEEVEVELERVPPAAPDPFTGALIYADSCSPCHGPTGLGDGEMSGSLEVEIPPLGGPGAAIDVIPADWYEIVTVGRMDRFMPPFRSLSDAQRWDVVAFALSLSTNQEQVERGQELYDQACAACHGEDGQGGEYEVDLTSLDAFAERSLNDAVAIIASGAGEMPAFGDVFDQSDQLALATFVRNLAYGQRDSVAEEQTESQMETAEAQVGSLQVSVTNGTAGASVPEALEVRVVAFDGEAQGFEEFVPVDAQGQAEVEDLEIVPGRIFGAVVEYQGVQYFSTGGHLLAEDPRLELDLTIYETTPDVDDIVVDRLHVIFDYAVEGIVEVSELWLISNNSDRTVVQRGGSNSLPIELPQGFGELRFGDEALAQRVTPTDEGFVYHEPIRPGEPQEVIFTFTLPYERSLDFVQPIDYPVGAVVLLKEESAPELSGSGLNDEGTRAMGELVLHTYTIESLEPGSTLALNFRGRHPAAGSNLSTTNVLIGAGVLVVTLAIVLFGWQTWTRRGQDHTEIESIETDSLPDRETLLQSIAELDEAFEVGDITQGDYERQRAALKEQLIGLMREDDD
jgi:mono/diheme cytochrome c family protein